MIRIEKGEAPAVLLGDGVTRACEHCDTFDNDAPYFLGGKPVPVSSDLYGHETVRNALADAQHGKCCYCEVRIVPPYMDGHVEHWRPKGRVRQERGQPSFYPGYYWLAYAWDNLLLACQACNRNFKSDQIPLADPAQRARDHHHNLHAEQPLLVKPDRDDPAVHIRWEEDHPFALTPEGEVTIRVVGLIRELDPSRGEVLTKVRAAVSRIKKYGEDGSPSVQELLEPDREHLRAAVLKSAPHSAMVRAYLLALGFVPDPGPPAAA